jgi:hypothetical protein
VLSVVDDDVVMLTALSVLDIVKVVVLVPALEDDHVKLVLLSVV